MDKLTEHYRRQFFLEAKEILEKVNDDILKFEAEPENQDLINSVFRGIHTIKGSAGSFDLEDIAEFSHHLEGILSALRDGKIILMPETVDVILSGTDHISRMVQDHAEGRDASIDLNLVERLKSFSMQEEHEEAATSAHHEQEAEGQSYEMLSLSPEIVKRFQDAAALGLYIFRVQVNFTSDLLENGYDPLIFLQNLRRSCTTYYPLEIENPVPSFDDFNLLSLYLHPVVFIATTLSGEEVADLTFDPDVIHVLPVCIPLGEAHTERIHEFADSAIEMIESLEKAVIDYETSGSKDALNNIFRMVHNLKGDADLVGLQEITEFAHTLESLLDRLRAGTIQRTFTLVDVILQSVDFLRQSALKLEQGTELPEFPPVFETLKQYAAMKDDLERKQHILQNVPFEVRNVFSEQVNQYKKILLSHIYPLPLDQERRDIVERALKGLFQASKYVDLKSLQNQADKAISASKQQDDQNLIDLVEKITAFISGIEEESDLKPVERIQEKEEAPLKMPISPEVRAMRVDERKVDYFTNMVGELLIARNTYAHLVDQLKDIEGRHRNIVKAIKDNLHLFSRLTNDIHHGVMSLRMIPIGRVLQKFNRVVRDISRRQKKMIQLLTGGEDIEIDKKVADMLSDPMIHLVRNACDHGIETPEVRKAAGKPEKGTVVIRASQEGGNLCIRVIDDGRGIDRQKLFKKVREAGIDIQSPDDPKLEETVFMPGISTNTEISEISGRGVGLDVVKTMVQALGGNVKLLSHEGKGLEITILIPLSIGTNTVLFVESGGLSYAIPLEYIVETLKIQFKKFKRAGTQMLFYHRGEVIAAQCLDVLLSEKGEARKVKDQMFHNSHLAIQNSDLCSVIILKTTRGKFGIIVDRLNRNVEVAIKSLPAVFSGIDIISGVSIMGDGKVFLVLNPEKFV